MVLIPPRYLIVEKFEVFVTVFIALYVDIVKASQKAVEADLTPFVEASSTIALVRDGPVIKVAIAPGSKPDYYDFRMVLIPPRYLIVEKFEVFVTVFIALYVDIVKASQKAVEADLTPFVEASSTIALVRDGPVIKVAIAPGSKPDYYDFRMVLIPPRYLIGEKFEVFVTVFIALYVDIVKASQKAVEADLTPFVEASSTIALVRDGPVIKVAIAPGSKPDYYDFRMVLIPPRYLIVEKFEVFVTVFIALYVDIVKASQKAVEADLIPFVEASSTIALVRDGPVIKVAIAPGSKPDYYDFRMVLIPPRYLIVEKFEVFVTVFIALYVDIVKASQKAVEADLTPFVEASSTIALVRDGPVIKVAIAPGSKPDYYDFRMVLIPPRYLIVEKFEVFVTVFIALYVDIVKASQKAVEADLIPFVEASSTIALVRDGPVIKVAIAPGSKPDYYDFRMVLIPPRYLIGEKFEVFVTVFIALYVDIVKASQKAVEADLTPFVEASSTIALVRDGPVIKVAIAPGSKPDYYDFRMVLIPPRYLIGEKFEVFVTVFIALYVDIVKASQKAVEADLTPFVEASSTIALVRDGPVIKVAIAPGSKPDYYDFRMVLIPPRYLIGEKFEVFVTVFIALYVDIVKASQKAVEADLTPFVEASSTIALVRDGPVIKVAIAPGSKPDYYDFRMVLIPPRYLIGEKFEVFVTVFIALYVDIVKASQKAVEADLTPFVEASSTIALVRDGPVIIFSSWVLFTCLGNSSGASLESIESTSIGRNWSGSLLHPFPGT
ncbi:unnamed protein product [Clavelina lepadiformis]|uniref:Uncharacterized protein n=1 Tax=Clavelina lepadiformis TaxID=159417 RepID=A0ABP0FXJ1_CLALP